MLFLSQFYLLFRYRVNLVVSCIKRFILLLCFKIQKDVFVPIKTIDCKSDLFKKYK